MCGNADKPGIWKRIFQRRFCLSYFRMVYESVKKVVDGGFENSVFKKLVFTAFFFMFFLYVFHTIKPLIRPHPIKHPENAQIRQIVIQLDQRPFLVRLELQPASSETISVINQV